MITNDDKKNEFVPLFFVTTEKNSLLLPENVCKIWCVFSHRSKVIQPFPDIFNTLYIYSILVMLVVDYLLVGSQVQIQAESNT